jgi:hypothetical protein
VAGGWVVVVGGWVVVVGGWVVVVGGWVVVVGGWVVVVGGWVVVVGGSLVVVGGSVVVVVSLPAEVTAAKPGKPSAIVTAMAVHPSREWWRIIELKSWCELGSWVRAGVIESAVSTRRERADAAGPRGSAHWLAVDVAADLTWLRRRVPFARWGFRAGALAPARIPLSIS